MAGPLDRAEVDPFLDHLVERRELAHALDGLDHLIGGEVHLFLSGQSSEAEADRGVSQLVADKAYEFLLVWSPLKMKGATGSPGNPVALY